MIPGLNCIRSSRPRGMPIEVMFALQSSEVPNSTWCEMEGLKRSVTFLKSQDLQLAAIITDRNRQVKMLVYTLGQMDVSLCSTLEKKVLLSQSHPKYTTFICYRLLSGCGRSCAQKERAITSISGTSVKVCDLIVMLCN